MQHVALVGDDLLGQKACMQHMAMYGYISCSDGDNTFPRAVCTSEKSYAELHARGWVVIRVDMQYRGVEHPSTCDAVVVALYDIERAFVKALVALGVALVW